MTMFLRFVLAAQLHRACYDLRRMVEDGDIVGLSFTGLGRGSRFDRSPPGLTVSVCRAAG